MSKKEHNSTDGRVAAGRIAAKFAELRERDEAALIPYIVAGDPDLESTARLVFELEARGADLIELGVPFSDPMADGPANQRAVGTRAGVRRDPAGDSRDGGGAAQSIRRFRWYCSATTTRFIIMAARSCARTRRAPESTGCW